MKEHESSAELLELFRTLTLSRAADDQHAEWCSSSLSAFQASCKGHESMAVFASHLTTTDILALHYRDLALLLASGYPLRRWYLETLGSPCAASLGRSLPNLSCFLTGRLLPGVTPVGNHALHAVGAAARLKESGSGSIVLCTLGDGACQQGEVLEALSEASRSALPILFVVENNNYALSTPTQRHTFFETRHGKEQSVFGIPILHLDGANFVPHRGTIADCVSAVRRLKEPRIIVWNVERLSDHSSADCQANYRNPSELERALRDANPIERLRKELIRLGFETAQLSEIAEKARLTALSEAKAALELSRTSPPGHESEVESPHIPVWAPRPLSDWTLCDAVRETLRVMLVEKSEAFIYGQDIEDPKGDIFRITKGLSTCFPGRVRNAPLSESTIVGSCIGRALAGQQTVACLQFVDFIPLALNQLLCEAATIGWRTGGSFNVPMVLLAHAGAYKPGLGPFHSATYDSLLAHMPGLWVAFPSNAEDCSTLLALAVSANRPVVVLLPKALLNLPRHQPLLSAERSGFGFSRTIRPGRDVTVVSWGAALRECEEAADELEKHGVEVELLDLRTLAPWDREGVLASVRRTGRLLVVHEDNLTGGFGAEIVATVAEAADGVIQIRRHCRRDTHIPFHFPSQLAVLPSAEGIIAEVASMLNQEPSWIARPIEDPSLLRAMAPNPADEQMTLVEWHVQEGSECHAGQLIAEMEAAKGVFELRSPKHGRVAARLRQKGDIISVGEPILRFCDSIEKVVSVFPSRRQLVGLRSMPKFPPPHQTDRHHSSSRTVGKTMSANVFIEKVVSVPASRVVLTEHLLHDLLSAPSAETLAAIGVRSRRWLEESETVADMADRALTACLADQCASAKRFGTLIYTSLTAGDGCPGMAARLAASHLHGERADVLAVDLNAACCGYLAALAIGYDRLLADPDHDVLIVTAEGTSRMLHPEDGSSYLLYADGGSATLLTTKPTGMRRLQLHRPFLRSVSDPSRIIVLERDSHHMPQLKVQAAAALTESVRQMADSIIRCCGNESISPGDLHFLIPQQVSARALSGLARKVGLPADRVFSTITDTGNLSTTSIPMALETFIRQNSASGKGALVGFGGGMMTGAALVTLDP